MAKKSWDLLHRSCWVTLQISTWRTSPWMEVTLALTYVWWIKECTLTTTSNDLIVIGQKDFFIHYAAWPDFHKSKRLFHSLCSFLKIFLAKEYVWYSLNLSLLLRENGRRKKIYTNVIIVCLNLYCL